MKATGTTTPEALAFWNAAGDMMAQLAGRWLDEQEYEDIADYATPLRPIAERCGVTITGMTRRPFGVRFAVGPKQFHATMSSRGQYRYVRTR